MVKDSDKTPEMIKNKYPDLEFVEVEEIKTVFLAKNEESFFNLVKKTDGVVFYVEKPAASWEWGALVSDFANQQKELSLPDRLTLSDTLKAYIEHSGSPRAEDFKRLFPKPRCGRSFVYLSPKYRLAYLAKEAEADTQKEREMIRALMVEIDSIVDKENENIVHEVEEIVASHRDEYKKAVLKKEKEKIISVALTEIRSRFSGEKLRGANIEISRAAMMLRLERKM